MGNEARGGGSTGRLVPYPFFVALMAMVVGALAAYGASGFRLAFDVISHSVYGIGNGAPSSGGMEEWFPRFEGVPLWKLLAGLGGGGLLLGVLPVLFRVRGYQGPADVILAMREHEGRIGLLSGTLTAAGSALAIGLGASVGRYGPAVTLGATVGSATARLLRRGRNDIQILLGCGVAGAIASSFNAPIAGVIFVHEAIVGHYALRAFAPITVASVTAFAVTHLHRFDYIALQGAASSRDLALVDYPGFAFLGLAGAVLAIVFMAGIFGIERVGDRLRLPGWLRPALAGAGTALIGWNFPVVLGLGDELIDALLDVTAFGWMWLAGVLAAKLAASCLCLGWRMPGGVFAPALFLGAVLGALLHRLPWDLDGHIAVIVCMAAVISSVVGAPIATILIVFELTRDYEAATAVMIGVVAANATVTRFYARSFFHRQLRRRGVDLDRGLEQLVLQRRTIGEIMREEFSAVPPEMPRSELAEQLAVTLGTDVFVVDGDGILLGRVAAADLLKEDETAPTVGDLCRATQSVLFRNQSIESALGKIEFAEARTIPVIESEDRRRLVGVVSDADLSRAYRDAVREVREERQ